MKSMASRAARGSIYSTNQSPPPELTTDYADIGSRYSLLSTYKGGDSGRVMKFREWDDEQARAKRLDLKSWEEGSLYEKIIKGREKVENFG